MEKGDGVLHLARWILPQAQAPEGYYALCSFNCAEAMIRAFVIKERKRAAKEVVKDA